MRGLNQLVRDCFPEILLDCLDFILFSAIFVYIAGKLLTIYIQRKTKNEIRRKWSSSPKDVVILHTTPRAVTAPVISPFALKLETFLRMANIPYQFDGEFPFGSKGKTPWITLNGIHLADSQLIIEFLTKKFDVKLGEYNDTERAYGRAARIMVDEHLYWGGLIWRFKYCDPAVLKSIYAPLLRTFPWIARSFIWRAIVKKFNKMAYAQGMGRHSYDEVTKIMSESGVALSKMLGNKPFILGNEPCDDDAAVFGLLALGLYASPGSEIHTVFEKCPNLVQYVERMRNKYWPDWDQLLNVQ